MSQEETQEIRTTYVKRSGAQLLDREIPADYRQERTSRIAAKQEQIEAGAISVVVFRIDREWLALPTELVQGVHHYSAPHTVPHRRGGILNGLVNVRGEILLSISLTRLLQLEDMTDVTGTKDLVPRRRLLVCNRHGSRFTFPVDEVGGVHRYHPKDLKAVPATLAKAGASVYTIAVLSWHGKNIGCLNAEFLFSAVDKSLA